MKKSTVLFFSLLTFALGIAFIAPPRDWGYDSQFFQGKVGVGRNPDATTNKFYVLGTSTNPGTVISDDDGGTIATVTDTTIVLDADEGVKISGARFTEAIGDTVASAGNLVLGFDGSTFPISGTTTINGISVNDWQSGSVVRLFFNASVTVADSASVTAPYQEINLSTGSNFSATKNDVLTLILNGTEWFEVSRTVNAD